MSDPHTLQMSQSEFPIQIPALCAECQALYQGWKWADGSVIRVGNVQRCGCGSTSFVDLTDSAPSLSLE